MFNIKLKWTAQGQKLKYAMENIDSVAEKAIEEAIKDALPTIVKNMENREDSTGHKWPRRLSGGKHGAYAKWKIKHGLKPIRDLKGATGRLFAWAGNPKVEKRGRKFVISIPSGQVPYARPQNEGAGPPSWEKSPFNKKAEFWWIDVHEFRKALKTYILKEFGKSAVITFKQGVV